MNKICFCRSGEVYLSQKMAMDKFELHYYPTPTYPYMRKKWFKTIRTLKQFIARNLLSRYKIYSDPHGDREPCLIDGYNVITLSMAKKMVEDLKAKI